MYNTDVVAREDEIKRKQEEFCIEIASKESKIESSKKEMREMSLIIQKKEAWEIYKSWCQSSKLMW